jgi:translocation and assembly module TamB
VRREPAFDAALDLVVSAPNRVFVRGRGIDAELGGQLRLSGRLKSPTTIGAFDLRRGRLQIIGTRLDFSRAHVAFTGDLTPDLDLLAQTRAGEVTAQVAVTGPASQPTFAFTSTPDLPQDEVLSQILFSKASGSLSPFQALQLAQAAAQFTGNGGPDTFERIRKSLGVDSLDVSTGRNGDPTVGISRAVNNKVSVGVKAGASSQDSGVTLDLDLTKRLRIQGEADANGGTALGVGTEIEY